MDMDTDPVHRPLSALRPRTASSPVRTHAGGAGISLRCWQVSSSSAMRACAASSWLRSCTIRAAASRVIPWSNNSRIRAANSR